LIDSGDAKDRSEGGGAVETALTVVKVAVVVRPRQPRRVDDGGHGADFVFQKLL